MRIGVIGTGYVGLVTAVCFSELGNEVFAYDKDKEKIHNLKRGISPIYEPGVEEILRKNLGKNLFFFEEIKDVVQKSEVIFICVGTPPLPDGSPDLSQVEECAIEIAKNLNGYKLIVEKSTVPVKTAEWIERTIKLYKRDSNFDVASNPEFLREGTAIEDFMNPDRIVIGVKSERAKEILLKLYENFKSPKIITDVRTAEVIKHASNSFLATKISYINMISDFCEKVGVDVDVVAEGIGLDPRIGKAFLRAGVGFGGFCLPKDLKAFIKMAKDVEVDFSLLEEVYKINEKRIDKLMQKIKNALWVIKGKIITILGLSFKPNTDDIREAPSIKIIPRLLEEKAILKLYDPKAMENTKKIFPPSDNIIYADNLYSAVENSNALVILTEWDEFKNMDLHKVKEKMITPIIIDGRNIFSPKVKEIGFIYDCIGKPH